MADRQVIDRGGGRGRLRRGRWREMRRGEGGDVTVVGGGGPEMGKGVSVVAGVSRMADSKSARSTRSPRKIRNLKDFTLDGVSMAFGNVSQVPNIVK